METSQIKKLLGSRGFVPTRAPNGALGFVGITGRVEYINSSILEWLETLPVSIVLEEGLLGVFPGDKVQVFTVVQATMEISRAEAYKYWGQIGIVDKVFKDKEFGLVAVVKMEGEEIVILPANQVTVIERPSQVDLRDVPQEERDARILEMIDKKITD